jgi:hypothetical protein
LFLVIKRNQIVAIVIVREGLGNREVELRPRVPLLGPSFLSLENYLIDIYSRLDLLVLVVVLVRKSQINFGSLTDLFRKDSSTR